MDQRTRSEATGSVDAKASLAAWLRAGRDRRKLTIEDVAKITKIQPRILERLESGSLDGLPAAVFVKGFVRSFAKCVGLDETEALDKYSAAQSVPASAPITVAKALVDTIATARSSKPAVPPVIEEPAVAPVEVAPAIEIAIDEPVIEAAPAIEPVVEAAPAVETAEPAVDAAVATPVETLPAKKRSRKKHNSAQRRKKKQAQAELIAQPVTDVIAPPAETITVEPVSIEIANSDGESVEAMAIEAKTDEALVAPAIEVSVDVAMQIEDGTVEAPSLAEGSQRISQPAIAIDAIAQAAAVTSDDTAGTWQPTMPPIAATPSVPWRRPSLPTSTAYVVPTLVIDDADPDSADREREDRQAKEPHRLSFLPPILLDREDRSARQGGLTLAVIILLIAATLTLSYLMRRPSPTGDGVTMLDTPSLVAYT